MTDDGDLFIHLEDMTKEVMNLKCLYRGSSAPTTTYAGMMWYDTTNNVFKQRDSTNTFWKIVNVTDGLIFTDVDGNTQYIPISARLVENSFVYFDGNYIVCRSKIIAAYYDSITHANIYPTTHEHSSWITQRKFTYGTYQWQGRFSAGDVGGEAYFGFEHHHGYPIQGIIYLMRCNGVGLEQNMYLLVH